jgi:hypothetical protein
MSIQEEITGAIAQTLVIDIFYKGTWRTVEPHLLGWNRKGNLCLSAFQVSGGSGSSWRAFLVNDIAELSITENAFPVREGYNPHDSTMESVIAAV